MLSDACDPPERVHEKIADLRERRAKHNLPPLKFGVAGYAMFATRKPKRRTSCVV